PSADPPHRAVGRAKGLPATSGARAGREGGGAAAAAAAAAGVAHCGAGAGAGPALAAGCSTGSATCLATALLTVARGTVATAPVAGGAVATAPAAGGAVATASVTVTTGTSAVGLPSRHGGHVGTAKGAVAGGQLLQQWVLRVHPSRGRLDAGLAGEVAHVADLVVSHQRDDRAGVARAGGAAGTVQVGLVLDRRVGVDDQRNVV